jgi:mono/diheme cytochrome c family protein
MMRTSAVALSVAGFAGAMMLAASASRHAVLAAGPAEAGHFVGLPQAGELRPPSQTAQYRATVNKYCVTCHNARTLTAGLALDQVNIASPEQHAAVWEKVVRKMRAGDMPPAGRPRPDAATSTALISWLEGSLDTAAAANPDPGRPLLHRLNRTEYANAIRDLLSLEIDAATLLPADDSTHGFDNISDALGISPLLLESYVVAARKISRLAVGNPSIPPLTETHVAAHDETQDYHQDGMPFGTRGGLRVQHHFPVDGQYEIRIRLEVSHLLQIRGLQEPHDLELAIDGQPIKVFTLDGGAHMYAQKVYDGESLSLTADAGLRVTVPVTAGPHEITATFPLKTSALVEDLSKPLLRSYLGTNDVKGMAAVSKVIVTGPFNSTGPGDTPNRRRVFSCQPRRASDEAACAKTIIASLARRAYRGLSTGVDVEELLSFYNVARQTSGFEAGVEAALWPMLASPKFIFRFEFEPENVPAGAVYRISDFELASRLSFLLWSSIPDDQLLDVAARRELRKPAVLKAQVRRMLSDPRAGALVDNFAGQWLYLRNLDRAAPDPKEFPNFDNNLRQALRRETELLFETIVREDRSVLDLLDADYTFVNERLARHYGIPHVRGSHFRRVSVTDPRRRGILGHGSILTVTSYANRTSPVLRGKWVLENILGTPPPPPPPDVPDLVESKNQAKVLTIRQRMAEHRANTVCASCHAKMDPIGFGMENFDATGALRTLEADNSPIDASGMLPNGTKFDGPAELQQALMRHPEMFVTTMTDKLLTYALGRGTDHYDAAAVRQIVRTAADAKYTFSSLILGIVNSVPFQMRKAADDGVSTAPAGAVR